MKSLFEYMIQRPVSDILEADDDLDLDLGGDSDSSDDSDDSEEKDGDSSTDTEEGSSDDSEEEDKKDDDAIDMNGFVVLKPEFLDKESELKERFESEGWKIVGEQEKKLSEDEVREFYSDKKDEPYFDDLVKYMTSDKCKCFMLWKEDSEDPIAEIQTIKEKLRTEWTDDEMKNGLHSSDSFDNMEKELSIFLKPEEKDSKKDDESDDSDDSGDSDDSDDGGESEDDSDNDDGGDDLDLGGGDDGGDLSL